VQQVDRKFILIVSTHEPHLLCVVDQHAADERVRLEELENMYLNMPAFPRTPVHVKMHLNETEQALVNNFQETLARWGFEIDRNTSTLISVPMVDHRVAGVEDFFEYLLALAVSPALRIRPPVITRFLHSRACRSAIMFGDKLSIATCEKLLSDLRICRLPFQCAHGRPSIIPLVQML
jgi:DNA mismatch repair protein MLH3